MKNYTDQLIEAYLLEWSNGQIAAFKDKFGEKTYDIFFRAQERLKKAGYTTDIQYYLGNKVSKEDLNKILQSLYSSEKETQKLRAIKDEIRDVRGNYKFFGEHQGFLVYQPLDARASMDLGINTGWCTTGRYEHAGHPTFEPSIKDAEGHFNDYTKQDIRLYYFLDPATFYGKYALALYPRTIDWPDGRVKYVDKEKNKVIVIERTNYELFNAEDASIWYEPKVLQACKEIGIDLELDSTESNSEIAGDFEISNARLGGNYFEIVGFLNDKATDVTIDFDDNVIAIGEEAFRNNKNIRHVIIKGNIRAISSGAFFFCQNLETVEIQAPIRVIDSGAFGSCYSLSKINLPNSLTKLSSYAFSSTAIEELTVPKLAVTDPYWIMHKDVSPDLTVHLTSSTQNVIGIMENVFVVYENVIPTKQALNEIVSNSSEEFINIKVNGTFNAKNYKLYEYPDLVNQDTGELINGQAINFIVEKNCNTATIYVKVI